MNKFLVFFIIFVINTSYANNFSAEYNVSTTGIKIGNFSWSLNINDNIYQTEINLKNSGIFSPLYKFEGSYLSTGVIENNIFKTQNYKQFWKTKKKTKIVKMSFDDYLIELKQEPIEEEMARIKLEDLYLYFDPITSFINILNGEDEAKTIDGRRIYILKKIADATDLPISRQPDICADGSEASGASGTSGNDICISDSMGLWQCYSSQEYQDRFGGGGPPGAG
mgnify:CR=1 FL=1